MDAKTPENLKDERREEVPDRNRRRPDDDAPRGDPQPAAKEAGDTRDDRLEQEDKRPKESWGSYLRRHAGWVAAGVVVLIVVAVFAVLWWLHARQFESTDDAFVDTRLVAINAQVAGAVTEVLVTDNQIVDAGTVLMRLDARIYRAQVDQARAQVEQAKASIANLEAQIEAQQARIEQADKQVEQAEAALTFAREEFSRYEALAKTGSGTVQQSQQSRSNLLQSEANAAGANANAVAARKQLVVLNTQRRGAAAQLEAAQAQLETAETNLSYTVIAAPVAGRVTKLTAAKGTYTAPGQALSMFVPRDIWVTANFKETQLALMRPGQPVDIRIDAFPGRTFHGHVDSIQAGSGTAFSLLPAENATGNYVKVVQRVPVKIVFDTAPEVELGPGMSVVPTVKVR